MEHVGVSVDTTVTATHSSSAPCGGAGKAPLGVPVICGSKSMKRLKRMAAVEYIGKRILAQCRITDAIGTTRTVFNVATAHTTAAAAS